VTVKHHLEVAGSIAVLAHDHSLRVRRRLVYAPALAGAADALELHQSVGRRIGARTKSLANGRGEPFASPLERRRVCARLPSAHC